MLIKRNHIRRIIQFSVIGILWSNPMIYCQIPTIFSEEEALENISINGEYEEMDASVDNLNQLPDLNSSSYHDLAAALPIPDSLINKLIAYREAYGAICTIYELLNITGFDQALIEYIEPMVSLHIQHSPIINQDFLLIKTGTKNLSELSTPNTLIKYRKENKRTGFSINLENDEGEHYSTLNKGGFDHISASFSFKGKKIIKDCIIGDFNVKSGLGLVINQSFSNGKSATVLQKLTVQRPIKKKSSANEYLFFRGAAATIALSRFSITGWFSNVNRDANITLYDTISNKPLIASSIKKTGLHITDDEISEKRAVRETSFGGALSYHGKRLNITSTMMHMQYNIPVIPADQFLNRNKFSGSLLRNGSLFYRYLFKRGFVSGEMAIDHYGHKALSNTAIIKMDDGLWIWGVARFFDIKYQSVFAMSISERTAVQNERGFLIGAVRKVNYNTFFEATADHYYIPYSTSDAGGGKYGAEYKLSASTTFWPLQIKGLLFYEITEKNHPENTGIGKTKTALLKQRYRVHIDYAVSESITFRLRSEWSVYNHSSVNTGHLVFMDMRYTTSDNSFYTIVRYALFDTDDYNSRIYAYEHDLLFSYSIPAFHGNGYRLYLVSRLKTGKNLRIWVKAGMLHQGTYRYDPTLQKIGSCNNKFDLRIQAIYYFKKKPTGKRLLFFLTKKRITKE